MMRRERKREREHFSDMERDKRRAGEKEGGILNY